MPVDEEVQQVLEAYAAFGAHPLITLSPQEARRRPTILDAVNALRRRRGEAIAQEAVGDVHDEVIQGPEDTIRVRVYRPEASGVLPILVYFHGGGWVLGGLESCDATCRALTNLAQCVVVSVDYRLAPEHRFPAAVQDAYAATQWAIAAASTLGVDRTRLAVGGEGAGGNLAAVVAMMARDSDAHLPIYQALVYPALNYAFDTPSYEHHAYVRPLTRAEMRWFWRQYLPNATAGMNAYASPLRAEDLTGLPPGLVITAEYDVLRDEGETYAQRLQEADVPMVVSRYNGMTHGFLDMAPVVEQARGALLEMASWLRTAFDLPELTAAEQPVQAAEAALGERREGTPEAAADHLAQRAPLREDAARGRGAPEAGAPLETGLVIRVGMEVVDSDGQLMGCVKAVRASDFVVDRRFRRDVALPFRVVQEAGERVILSVPARDATRTDWSQLSP